MRGEGLCYGVFIVAPGVCAVCDVLRYARIKHVCLLSISTNLVHATNPTSPQWQPLFSPHLQIRLQTLYTKIEESLAPLPSFLATEKKAPACAWRINHFPSIVLQSLVSSYSKPNRQYHPGTRPNNH